MNNRIWKCQYLTRGKSFTSKQIQYWKRNLKDVPSVQSLVFLMWFISGDLTTLNFPELRKFARVIFHFEITFTCEKAFLSMKLIKCKAKSHLTYSNLKNYLLLGALSKQFISITWNKWWNRSQFRTKLIKKSVNVKFVCCFTRYSDSIQHHYLENHWRC